MFGQPRHHLQTPTTAQGLLPWILLLVVILLLTACQGEALSGKESPQWLDSQDPGATGIASLCSGEEGVYPLGVYIVELYQRLTLANELTNQRQRDKNKWERILTVHEEGPNGRLLSFNITTLRSYKNLTAAKVAVDHEDDVHHSPCQAGLALSHHEQGYLACEDQPFMVRNMATFDVTSVLSSALRKSEEMFTVNASHTVPSALLVVFIDVEGLLEDRTPLRCRRAPARHKRDTDALDRLLAMFQLKESDSLSVPTTQKIVQVENKIAHYPKYKNSRTSRLAHRTGGAVGMKKRLRGLGAGRRSSTILTFNEKEHQRWVEGASKLHIDEEEKAKRHLTNDSGSKNERIYNTKNHSAKIGISRKRLSFSEVMGDLLKRSLRPYSPRLLSRLGSGPVFQTQSQLLQHVNIVRKRREVPPIQGDPCEPNPFPLDPVADLKMPPLISPEYLQIGLCRGDCPAVLQPNNVVTYYAHLISLYNSHWGTQDTNAPTSCRPIAFSMLTILRWRDFQVQNVALENWWNARVTSCSCGV